jgi:hypothetical protein
MEDFLMVSILLLIRFGIPLAVMTLVAMLYSRYQQRHAH